MQRFVQFQHYSSVQCTRLPQITLKSRCRKLLWLLPFKAVSYLVFRIGNNYKFSNFVAMLILTMYVKNYKSDENLMLQKIKLPSRELFGRCRPLMAAALVILSYLVRSIKSVYSSYWRDSALKTSNVVLEHLMDVNKLQVLLIGQAGRYGGTLSSRNIERFRCSNTNKDNVLVCCCFVVYAWTKPASIIPDLLIGSITARPFLSVQSFSRRSRRGTLCDALLCRARLFLQIT